MALYPEPRAQLFARLGEAANLLGATSAQCTAALKSLDHDTKRDVVNKTAKELHARATGKHVSPGSW